MYEALFVAALLLLSPGTGSSVQQSQGEDNDINQLRLAAEQGHAESQFRLGMLDTEGLGVEKDLSEAYKWLDLAALNGLQKAANQRDLVAERLSPEQILESQEAARNWKPNSQPRPQR